MASHQLITWSVDPPVIPDAVYTNAMSMAREGQLAATVTEDRPKILTAAAAYCEQYLERLIFQGESGSPARNSVAEIEVDEYGALVSVCPRYPDMTGITISNLTVEMWKDDASAYEAYMDFKRRPGGRLKLMADRTYKITVDLLAPATPNKVAEQAVARLFAAQERLRAGDLVVQGTGITGGLNNLLHRSGARDLLDSIKTRWSI